MQAILFTVVSWLVREVIVKFVVLSALFAVMAFLIPKVIDLVLPWVGGSSLTAAFAGIPSGVWYFLDFFQLGYGVPLILSAYVTRFLIRRLPFVG